VCMGNVRRQMTTTRMILEVVVLEHDSLTTLLSWNNDFQVEASAHN
jgi:hypothetical protein